MTGPWSVVRGLWSVVRGPWSEECMAFLELTNVRKAFAQSTAVHNFNLQVERGEFVSFLGPSGCGKTTTLRMIAGFETPTSGTIMVDGQDITYRSPNQRNVGMVFQSYALFPNMTVADNIGFGLKIARKPAEEIQQRITEMLRIIHMPELWRALPVPALGRAAAARRAGPRAGYPPAGAAARRAALGARRQDPRVAAPGDPLHPAPARHHQRSMSPTTRRRRSRYPTGLW